MEGALFITTGTSEFFSYHIGNKMYLQTVKDNLGRLYIHAEVRASII
jgi:hypothetical protein